MFIGHFAIAFAAKKNDNKPSPGTTFFAAQWLDLLWPVLLLTGTESAAIAPEGSKIPLEFTNYPISHSLLFVLFWALLFGLLYYFIKRNVKAAILIGLLVMSHWLLDLLVHVPDLPLSPSGDLEFGLGLWNYKYTELVIELGLFMVGVYLYLKSMKAKSAAGNIILWSLIIFLLVVHLLNSFGPPPKDMKTVATMALTEYLLIAWAYWADANRTPVT